MPTKSSTQQPCESVCENEGEMEKTRGKECSKVQCENDSEEHRDHDGEVQQNQLPSSHKTACETAGEEGEPCSEEAGENFGRTLGALVKK